MAYKKTDSQDKTCMSVVFCIVFQAQNYTSEVAVIFSIVFQAQNYTSDVVNPCGPVNYTTVLSHADIFEAPCANKFSMLNIIPDIEITPVSINFVLDFVFSKIRI